MNLPALLLLALAPQSPTDDPVAADPTPAQDPDPAESAATLESLRKRLQDFESRFLERAHIDRVAQRRDSTLTQPAGTLGLKGEDMTLRIGGYVKFDAIHDAQAIGNRSKFATATIPVPTLDRSRTTFQARETRLNADVRSAIEGQDLRFFIEGDFYGTGDTFSLRHAYGEVGKVLAGQTWTTFMDLSSRPATLDFEGPDSALFIRQPMVRWTDSVGEHATYSLALEGSSQGIGGNGGDASGPGLPDLTGNYRRPLAGGHIQASGVLRQLDGRTAGGDDRSATGWGLALSSKVPLSGPDLRLLGQVSVGEGMGRYIQALRDDAAGQYDGFIDAGGDLQALGCSGYLLGVEKDWTDRWTSTFALATATLDNEAGQAAGILHRSNSASANLVYHPSRHYLVGFEYLYGEREDNDGRSGSANRIMVSLKFFL